MMNAKEDNLLYHEKDNLVLKLSFEFSLKIVEYCELLNEQRKFVIANQLLRSGTSIDANIREAQNAESKQDFIHKFKIAAKEGDETEYGLLLCKHSKGYPVCDYLLAELISLKKIISKIISSSKRNSQSSSNYRIIESPNQ